jgi:hypothetical protein
MKPVHFLCIAMLPLLTLAAATAPSTSTAPSIAAIKEVQGLAPNAAAFAASGSAKPITIKTEKEVATYFSEADAARFAKEVDFKNQIVVVFAWSGSGQDKIEYTIAESFPEQVRFTYTPGRTRDLRPHVGVYVLRSNVTWSVK